MQTEAANQFLRLALQHSEHIGGVGGAREGQSG
jgi:hypothetical protein